MTIALGSILASMGVSKDLPLLDGIVGLVGLIGLQWAVAWINLRSVRWQKLIKSEPRLLAYRGELEEEAMRHERINGAAVQSALRQAGLSARSTRRRRPCSKPTEPLA